MLGLAATCAALGAAPLVAAPAPPAPPAVAPAPAPPARVLQQGDSGPSVVALQEALVAQGERLTVDGEYGPATERAVQRVRARLGLPPGLGVDAELVARLGIVLPASPALRMCPPPADPATGRARHLTTFPVRGPVRYTDDFGDARGQGAHEGIDLLTARGQPVVAAADGRIDRLARSETGLGGIYIWQRAADGAVYYYAHLDAIVPGLEPGDRVLAGHQIATVGNTGDARYGAPHLHFEVHPGGGAAVNPYRDLRAVEADAAGSCGGDAPRPVAAPAAPAATVAPPAAEPRAARVTLSARQLLINQRISQAAVRRVNALRARLGGPPAPPPRGSPGTVRFSVAQMRINQRISQTAVRRVNAISAQLAGRRRTAERRADVAAAPVRITLSAAQLRINQRISQAALRRVNALLAALPPASA